jgi:hypothetical protein
MHTRIAAILSAHICHISPLLHSRLARLFLSFFLFWFYCTLLWLSNGGQNAGLRPPYFKRVQGCSQGIFLEYSTSWRCRAGHRRQRDFIIWDRNREPWSAAITTRLFSFIILLYVGSYGTRLRAARAFGDYLICRLDLCSCVKWRSVHFFSVATAVTSRFQIVLHFASVWSQEENCHKS